MGSLPGCHSRVGSTPKVLRIFSPRLRAGASYLGAVRTPPPRTLKEFRKLKVQALNCGTPSEFEEGLNAVSQRRPGTANAGLKMRNAVGVQDRLRRCDVLDTCGLCAGRASAKPWVLWARTPGTEAGRYNAFFKRETILQGAW